MNKINLKKINIISKFKNRMYNNELLNVNLLKSLIIFLLIIHVISLFFPFLASNDASFYAVVAKELFQSDNWINLTYSHVDWLDKPHLPFWITVISYKVFGINSFAYILPGFIFYLIGSRYTFLLAKLLYNNQIALVSTLIYLSSLHLMTSSIDVRAEAFLVGLIIPACYYWYIYNESDIYFSKNLILGSLFTSMSIMTKGIFVLIPIFSGVVGIIIYNKQWKSLYSSKWIFVFLTIFLMISPELISLYLQFDLHPEKFIYGHYHVSGIKFFFWDSQFGRFFNSGPIVSNHKDHIAHYFYFIHTLLWSILPWSLIFIVSLYSIIKDLRFSRDVIDITKQKKNYIFLLCSIIPIFILFSLTNFQLDHYTNIIIPFTSIICSLWICNKATRVISHPIFHFQTILSYFFCILIMVFTVLIFYDYMFLIFIISGVLLLNFFVIIINNSKLNNALVFSVLSISFVFLFIIMVGDKIYQPFNVGYNISEFLNNKKQIPVVDYNLNSSSLEFYSYNKYIRINTISDLQHVATPYYLIINVNDWMIISRLFNSFNILNTFQFIKQEKFIPYLFKNNKNLIDLILVIQVNNNPIL